MSSSKKNTGLSQFPAKDAIQDLHYMWHEHPDLIRQFLEMRPDYEQLCAEIGYILTKRLKAHGIEVSTITWRAKTLNSFLEKINRKSYTDPFIDIKDFAGIRVVYLYKQDERKIGEIIQEEFEVEEKVDKLEEKDADRFGYLATHFVARSGKGSSGARYEDYKELCFEIQVRTVLQDAWAIIDHHLAYKRESDIPKPIQRQLTRIAGMFELVDEEFNRIQQSTLHYIADLKESSHKSKDQFLNNDLDLNSFVEYLKWKFKGIPLEDENKPGINQYIFQGVDKKKYPNLLKLDEAVNSADQTKIIEVTQKIEQKPNHFGDNSAGLQFSIALGMVDNEFLEDRHTPPWVRSAILSLFK